MQRGDRMDADGSPAQGVNAAGPTANGDDSNRTASEGDTSNTRAPKRKETDGKTADRKNATCQAAKGKPAGRHVAESEDAASVTAHLTSLPIRTDRDGPERQAEELARGLAADTSKREPREPLRTQELVLRLGELLWSQRSLGAEFGESLEFFDDVHGIS